MKCSETDNSTNPEEILSVLENLLQTSDTIIIILDPSCRIRCWNYRAREMFNYTEEEVRGRLLEELDIRSFSGVIMKAIEESTKSRWQVYLDDLHIKTGSGKGKYIGLKVVPVFLKNGGPAGYLIDGKDISEIREIRRQHAESQKFRAIGELSAGIIHEINTPVQFIRNNLQYLSSLAGEMEAALQERAVNVSGAGGRIRELFEEYAEVVGQSLEGMDRIIRMIRSLRNYAHPGKDKPVPFSPARAIEDALTISGNELKRVGEVRVEIPEEEIRVPGYPSDFSQAMVNLIINAVEAVADRFGPAASTDGVLAVCLEKDGDSVTVKVQDNGTGMSEELQSRIFEPFFTTREFGKGTGQGLAMVYSCITGKHRGNIKVDSVPGSGSTFTLTLPGAERP